MEEYVFDNILKEIETAKIDAGEVVVNPTADNPEIVSVSLTVDYKTGPRKVFHNTDALFHGDTASAKEVHLLLTNNNTGVRTVRKVAALNPASDPALLDYIKSNGAFGTAIIRV